MYILAAVLVCLAILITAVLLGSAGLRIYYGDGGLKLHIILFGIPIPIGSRKNKNKNNTNKTSDKAATREDTGSAGQKNDKKGDALGVLRKILSLISAHRYKLTINKISIKIEIGIDDAAKTAMVCGGIYTLVYSLLGGLQNVFIVNKPSVNIIPLYNQLNFSQEYLLEIKGRIISLIKIGYKAYKTFKEKE